MDSHRRAMSAHMFERKQFACTLELKALEESGRFAGYASVFDVVDNQRDVMLPGAFAQTLAGRAAEIRLLWQHEVKEPIGVIEHIFEDGRGLYVEGRLLLEVARAREAYALLKAGALRGLSIGYSPVRYRIDPENGVRMLAAVQLWEVSLVTFPANAASRITVVKGEGAGGNEEAEMQALLRTGQALAFCEALDRGINILRLYCSLP